MPPIPAVKPARHWALKPHLQQTFHSHAEFTHLPPAETTSLIFFFVCKQWKLSVATLVLFHPPPPLPWPSLFSGDTSVFLPYCLGVFLNTVHTSLTLNITATSFPAWALEVSLPLLLTLKPRSLQVTAILCNSPSNAVRKSTLPLVGTLSLHRIPHLPDLQPSPWDHPSSKPQPHHVSHWGPTYREVRRQAWNSLWRGREGTGWDVQASWGAAALKL